MRARYHQKTVNSIGVLMWQKKHVALIHSRIQCVLHTPTQMQACGRFSPNCCIKLRIVYSFTEYFDRGDYNLFFVDWSELARAPCYPSAAHNTKHAGECIGQLVNRIHDAGSSGENIHIIGFSLGSHVASFAANHAKNFKVRRITGTYINATT